jgi:hypothetical protein
MWCKSDDAMQGVDAMQVEEVALQTVMRGLQGDLAVGFRLALW